MKRSVWFITLVVVCLALTDFAAPLPLLAGGFVITDVSTQELASTTTGFEFGVHASAVWVGDQSTSGFDRLFRTFWWVSGVGWCDNGTPGKHCGSIGRVVNAPPFFPGYTIHCNSQNGCAANRSVPKPCCDGLGLSYSGKADVVNLHGGTGIDDLSNASVQSVPCRECGGPGPPETPCHDPEPQLHVEPVTGSVPSSAESVFSPFPLERVESLRGIHYLMEEWAVLVIGRDALGAVTSVDVPAASSSAYAAQQHQSFAESSVVADGDIGSSPPGAAAERSVLLVVHQPNHRHNERWIPLPQAHLSTGSPSGEGAGGRAVVRADFGEDRKLIALDVLYSDRPLTEEERWFLESNLTLRYGNDDEHRVVLYGVVRLGGRSITLEHYLPVRPMCCCPDWPDCSEPQY